jgi:hypothetical protein
MSWVPKRWLIWDSGSNRTFSLSISEITGEDTDPSISLNLKVLLSLSMSGGNCTKWSSILMRMSKRWLPNTKYRGLVWTKPFSKIRALTIHFLGDFRTTTSITHLETSILQEPRINLIEEEDSTLTIIEIAQMNLIFIDIYSLIFKLFYLFSI